MVMRTLLVGLGTASAILGGAAALQQRHLKRLLAFSTISHAGILLVGVALLSPRGLAGMLVYFAGHGLVKGALFMLVGVALATLAGIDEIGLRGKGRRGSRSRLQGCCSAERP
ncbi:MAG: proton-conducting transporter membrane subunit [Steroidobacteraceae bacterium]